MPVNEVLAAFGTSLADFIAVERRCAVWALFVALVVASEVVRLVLRASFAADTRPLWSRRVYVVAGLTFLLVPHWSSRWARKTSSPIPPWPAHVQRRAALANIIGVV